VPVADGVPVGLGEGVGEAQWDCTSQAMST
jgi:hypothetical protein